MLKIRIALIDKFSQCPCS